MIKQKFYLDTSVFNFLLTEDEPTKRKVTEELFKKLPDLGEIYISDIVSLEVLESSSPIRERLIAVINKQEPTVLSIDEEIRELAEEYIRAGIIPAKYRDDALHIAVAVVNRLDVIVSWNFEHIVKLKTKREVNGLNLMLGYKEIEIVSPEEVI